MWELFGISPLLWMPASVAYIFSSGIGYGRYLKESAKRWTLVSGAIVCNREGHQATRDHHQCRDCEVEGYIMGAFWPVWILGGLAKLPFKAGRDAGLGPEMADALKTIEQEKVSGTDFDDLIRKINNPQLALPAPAPVQHNHKAYHMEDAGGSYSTDRP
jgi:hypothetical protein